MCVLSSVWLARAPDWEPLIVLLGFLGVYLGYERQGSKEEASRLLPGENQTASPNVPEKLFHKKPLAVLDCTWNAEIGGWVDKMGVAYCHKCAVGDARSPMKRITATTYRCPACTSPLHEISGIKERHAISDDAFCVLCSIMDEDGKLTDEHLAKRFRMTKPEVALHVRRLEDKSFITGPSDLDIHGPDGYRILPDGTEYVLKNRPPPS